jgi:hypothetical protein
VLLHNYVIDRSADYLWRDLASSPAILNDYYQTLSSLLSHIERALDAQDHPLCRSPLSSSVSQHEHWFAGD